MDLIDYDDFAKLDIRVVRIKEAERVEGSKKLLKLKVYTGEEDRTLVAGIADQYDPDELVGRKIVMLLNLKPKKIFGIESQGMLLAADDGNVVALLNPDKDISEGSKIR